MNRRLITGLTLAALAVPLVVLGAAARPLVVDERAAAPDVLSPTEVGFLQDMSAHHHQALVMVQRLDPAVEPAVWRLAQQIDDTQRTEIGMMLGWLRLAGATPTNERPMSWMPEHHEHPGTGHHPTATAAPPAAGLMPGMATQAELDALAAARGRDAAVLFLQLMQRHHAGGIDMAAAADKALTGGVVEQAAREMLSTQSQETGLMGLLLAELTTA